MSKEIEDQIYLGAAYGALKVVFAAEWIRLESSDQRLIEDDYEFAAIQEDCTAREYQERIGKDNLASYVRCLKA